MHSYDPRISLEGNGRAVVLVPGMNGSGDLFYRQVPLLRRSYRVATYTLRDDAPSLDMLAHDLAHIVDTAAPVERRAIIVGESFGGAVALTFALLHPERVDALVILNSFSYFVPQLRLRLAIAGLSLVPWNIMPAVRQLTAWRLHSRHTHRAEMKRFVELTANATRAGYVNRLRLLRSYDVRNRLRDIKAPSLFLAAELDHLVPSVREAHLMSERMAGSAMRILSGHGHICLIAPDLDLASIITEWRG